MLLERLRDLPDEFANNILIGTKTYAKEASFLKSEVKVVRQLRIFTVERLAISAHPPGSKTSLYCDKE